jgi:hypothetical protein
MASVRHLIMATLLEQLPGIELPVAKVAPYLKSLWLTENAETGEDAGLFRASQLNLVLHFGLDTPFPEARSVFETAVQFAERYPARIIVLCPEARPKKDAQMTGKVYTQCFIGDSGREKSCSEILMLGYQPGDHGFLENQVSIWLESDLPLYHWFHRVPAQRIRDQYLPFTRFCRRVIYDQSIERDDFREIQWPKGIVSSDLAQARILPLRQSLGQFLSGYDPNLLLDGVKRVRLSSHPELVAEADCLEKWLKSAFEQGFHQQHREEGLDAVEFQRSPAADGYAFQLKWVYADGKDRFCWELRSDWHHGLIESKWRDDYRRFPFRLKAMQPREVLAEAIFFSS